MLLAALACSALCHVAHGAIALNKHRVKAHLEWNEALVNEEWDNWQEAFRRADTDGDNKVTKNEIATVFKEHHNLLTLPVNHIYDQNAHESHYKVPLPRRPQFLPHSRVRAAPVAPHCSPPRSSSPADNGQENDATAAPPRAIGQCCTHEHDS